mgnify:CR=1 FL=1
MTFYLFAIVVLCIYQIRIYQKLEFCEDYLSRENTTSIKGIFVLLVVAQHFITYVKLDGIYDGGYLQLRQFLGQNIVTVFLFYSGYGVLESIKRKGKDYIRKMPVKRFLLTLIHFDFAVLLFVLVDHFLKKQFPARTVLLAFTGWTGIGNSNWYVFAALCTYLFTWISFLVLYKHPFGTLILTTALLAGYILVVHHYRPDEGWWYNTVLCYAEGMWYSYFKEDIERLLFDKKHPLLYYILLILSALGVIMGRAYIYHLPVYIMWTMCFTGMVVLVTMKVSVHNKILYWLGCYTFEIYILQRIPMMIFSQIGWMKERTYLFLICTVGATLLIAKVFHEILKCLDKKILFLTKAG